jgi:Dna[CI] antecedent, DciA
VRFLNFSSAGKALYPRPKALTQFLDRLPALSAALLHAREGSRQFDVLIEAVPERLKRFIVAMSASGSTLSITVASAEAAHLTRLLSTEMLTNLDRKGLKFNEISLKTQSNSASAIRPRLLPEPESQRKLNATADRIKSERMQTSLKRLAKTVANR